MTSLTSRLQQLEYRLAAEKSEARRQSLQNFAETLVAEGKISRSDQPGLVDFMTSLPEEQSAYFQGFLSDRPKVEEFAMPIEVQIAYKKARNQYESAWKGRREL